MTANRSDWKESYHETANNICHKFYCRSPYQCVQLIHPLKPVEQWSLIKFIQPLSYSALRASFPPVPCLWYKISNIRNSMAANNCLWNKFSWPESSRIYLVLRGKKFKIFSSALAGSWTVFCLLLFCAIFFSIWKQNLPLKWNVFLSDVCQLRSRQHRQLFTFLNVKFLSSTCSNFVVECDWSSKISQNFQSLASFEKNR